MAGNNQRKSFLGDLQLGSGGLEGELFLPRGLRLRRVGGSLRLDQHRCPAERGPKKQRRKQNQGTFHVGSLPLEMNVSPKLGRFRWTHFTSVRPERERADRSGSMPKVPGGRRVAFGSLPAM